MGLLEELNELLSVGCRHEFELTLGDREGQGSLACCSPWGHKESDMTEQLNNNKCKVLTNKRYKEFALVITHIITVAISLSYASVVSLNSDLERLHCSTRQAKCTVNN